jgi:uncharacterized protein YbjT (DUF2867 family)
VRVVTRKPESQRAAELRRRGAEVVRGDFEDPMSLRKALHGADAFFAGGTAHRVGPDGEVRHGINAAEAAKAAGVGHFVYLSGSGAGARTGVPVFDGKGVIEAYIRSQEIPHTILAPVYFMENIFNPWNLPALGAGVFPSPVGPDRPVQQVALGDVVAFTALVLETPEEFVDQRVEIASDERTGAEIAQELSRAAGRRFDLQRVEVRWLPSGVGRLFEWLERVGDRVAALHARYPQVDRTSFERWAQRQAWDQLASIRKAS